MLCKAHILTSLSFSSMLMQTPCQSHQPGLAFAQPEVADAGLRTILFCCENSFDSDSIARREGGCIEKKRHGSKWCSRPATSDVPAPPHFTFPTIPPSSVRPRRTAPQPHLQIARKRESPPPLPPGSALPAKNKYSRYNNCAPPDPKQSRRVPA